MKKNIFKKSRFYIIVSLLTLLPIVTFAFTRGSDGYNYYDYQSNYSIGGSIFGGGSGLFCFGGTSHPTFCSIVNFFIQMMGRAIPILISISVIIFVWGVFKYVIYDGEDRQKSRDFMLYGIIGLFVMVSVWGLVAVVRNTLGLNNSNNSFINFGGGIGSGFGGGSNTTSNFREFFGSFLGKTGDREGTGFFSK